MRIEQSIVSCCVFTRKEEVCIRKSSFSWFPHTINCLKDIPFVEKEKIGDIEHVLTSKRTML